MVTVTSTERLGLNPSVQLTTMKPKYVTPDPVDGEAQEPELVLVGPSDLSIALETGTFTIWTGTETNPAGAADKWYVVVSASDSERQQGCDWGRGVLQRRSVYRTRTT